MTYSTFYTSRSHGIPVPHNYQLRPLLTTFLRLFSWTLSTWDLGISWAKIRFWFFEMKIIRYPYQIENFRSYDVEHFQYLSTVCTLVQFWKTPSKNGDRPRESFRMAPMCDNGQGHISGFLMTRRSGGAWRTSDSIFWQDRC